MHVLFIFTLKHARRGGGICLDKNVHQNKVFILNVHVLGASQLHSERNFAVFVSFVSQSHHLEV